MTKAKKTKAVVAMSGGVDSSVTALLLKQNHDVTGMFMRLGATEAGPAEAAARSVCRKLKIPFYPVNLATAFRREVVKYFLDSYKAGVTPNPCVNCNRLIKFGELLKRARDLGAEYLATGHYARLRREFSMIPPTPRLRRASNDQFSIKLLKAKDGNKDQSYFLYTLTQAQLKHVLFPLGEMKKTEARRIADKAGLPYLKKESQDVCFMHENGKIIEHNEFLKKHIKLEPGPIKEVMSLRGAKQRSNTEIKGNGTGLPRPFGPRNDKVIIGEHQGLPLYTVGQRKGVEIGGTGPYYVARADYKTNTLYVVKDFDDQALYSDECYARGVNLIAGQAPKLPLRCEAVIRYRHKAVECKVIKLKVKSYKVLFDEPQRAVTAGQSVVFYDGDEVLGGGVIGF